MSSLIRFKTYVLFYAECNRLLILIEESKVKLITILASEYGDIFIRTVIFVINKNIVISQFDTAHFKIGAKTGYKSL